MHGLSLLCFRYGFKGSPRLSLVAKPRLGQRQVHMAKVTHWIERKLCELVEVSRASFLVRYTYILAVSQCEVCIRE